MIGFLVGIGLFFWGFAVLQRRRLILDTPFSKIRSAPMGLVELSGQACGPYTLVSPVSARPCYFYRTLVWEYKQQGKNKQWVQVASECMFVPFFVDDGTGRVLVDPRGAELDLHHDFEQQFSNSFFTTLDPAPGNLIGFLARRGVSTNNALKVQECCIKPKNALFVLGTMGQNSGLAVTAKPIEDFGAEHVTATRLSFPINISVSSTSTEDGFDSGAFALYMSRQTTSTSPVVAAGMHEEVVRLSADSAPLKTSEMTQQQKIAAALMKAGISNPAAWSAAGVEARGVQVLTDPAGNGSNGSNGHAGAEQDAPATNGFDPHPPVVLKKGTNDKNFVISWRSQRELANSLGWKCTAMIWGGAAIALASLYVFLSIEHLI